MVMAERQRLSKVEWCEAALATIADGGTAAVSVERLARQLGVTKGSFYWHFEDRAELIRSALDHWADAATRAVIDHLSAIPEPTERLRALFAESFGDERSSLDVMLATSTGDPVVAEVVGRVTRARLDFLTATCRELGLSPARAKRQAHIMYATYLGHFQLARVLDGGPDGATPTKPYLDQLLATLAPER